MSGLAPRVYKPDITSETIPPVWEKYFSLLSKPGAAVFAFSGLLSRMPIAMHGIGLTLLVQIQYDSYGLAGLAAAIYAGSWALHSIPSARLTDRIGQRRAMIPLAVLSSIGVVTTITVALAQGPVWWVLMGAVASGFTGPLGSLSRARWSHLLTTDREIHTAFSLEGALDEILFIGGPALVTVLAVSVWPPLGVIVSHAGFIIGLVIFLSQRKTEPPARASLGEKALGFAIPPAIWAVASIALTIGLVFGAVDISVVAFAEEFGVKDKAGFILAAIALGSLVGGLTYGAIDWKASLRARVVGSAVLIASGFAVLALSPHPLVLAATGMIVGLSIAPAMAGIDNVVQRTVAPAQLTEGMAWLRIGLGIGVAVGAWSAGATIDAGGARDGLYLTAIGGALVLVASALAWRPLRQVATREDVASTPR